MRRDFADVGQNPQTMHRIGEHVLHRLARVVRNGKGLHLELTNDSRAVAADYTEVQSSIGLPSGTPGAVSHPEWKREFPGEAKSAPQVIAMLVSDKDAGQVSRLTPKSGKPGHGFPQPEAAIEHQAGVATLDQQRVTRTAAAERGETNHCNCWRSSPRIFLAVSDLSVPPSLESTWTTLC